MVRLLLPGNAEAAAAEAESSVPPRALLGEHPLVGKERSTSDWMLQPLLTAHRGRPTARYRRSHRAERVLEASREAVSTSFERFEMSEVVESAETCSCASPSSAEPSGGSPVASKSRPALLRLRRMANNCRSALCVPLSMTLCKWDEVNLEAKEAICSIGDGFLDQVARGEGSVELELFPQSEALLGRELSVGWWRNGWN